MLYLFILSENKNYNLYFEIIPYDPQIPLGEQKSINPNNGELRYFRNWSHIKEEDIKHIKIFKRMEEGEIFYLSSIDEFMPWWLKDEMQTDKPQTDINVPLNAPDHATSSAHLTFESRETPETNDKSSIYNFRIAIKPHHQTDATAGISKEFDTSRKDDNNNLLDATVDLSGKIIKARGENNTDPLDATFILLEEIDCSREGNDGIHSKVNKASCQDDGIKQGVLNLSTVPHQQCSRKNNRQLTDKEKVNGENDRPTFASLHPESRRTITHNSSKSSISPNGFQPSSMSSFREQRYKKAIADCKTIKKFVDDVLERDEYYSKKAEEEGKLTHNFEEAAIKTEVEKFNLTNKGIINKRYADFMKRLSTNSKMVSDEAVLARAEYNKNAKSYNETTKVLKEIKISTNVQNALTNLLVFKDIPKQIKTAPYYITARDLYSSKEYELLIKRISEK